MHRMHLHVSVPDLGRSISFYETLFGAPPAVVKDDYAKWMLEDPRVNFAISQRNGSAGVDHVGIQADTTEELQALAGRLKAAGAETFDQEATTCCYARSDKTWVSDPAGLRWETFFTFGESTAYGEDPGAEPAAPADAACCGAEPRAEAGPPCCQERPATGAVDRNSGVRWWERWSRQMRASRGRRGSLSSATGAGVVIGRGRTEWGEVERRDRGDPDRRLRWRGP